MTYIDVPDMNDSMSLITIDEKEYMIRFCYNDTYDYWSFGIYDDEENPIVTSVKIVPDYPLLQQYSDIRLPDGDFYCFSDSEEIGRNAFIDLVSEFVYVPNEDDDEDGDE